MKYLKWVAILLVILIVSMIVCVNVLSKKMPQAIAGDGDALAESMFEALNKPAWDTLGYLQWTFQGHEYAWDKKNNIANIQWGKNEVILDLDKLNGRAYTNNMEVVDQDKKAKLINRAWSFWCNDSFWMFAPFKVKDPGTSREVVSIEEEPESKGLKVTYDSGGVTPGDTYVWVLDDQNIPTGYYMYVEIIPVKGAYTSWIDWIEIGGAKFAIGHKNSLMSIEMQNVKGGNDVSTLDIDPSRLVI